MIIDSPRITPRQQSPPRDIKLVCSLRPCAHPSGRRSEFVWAPAFTLMKSITLRWLGVSVAAASAVVCWYLLTVEPDSASRTKGKGLAPAAHMSGKQSVSTLAGPLPKFGTPEFKNTLHERGQKWLDSRGRDAAGLIAMWDLTRDKALLAEAAKKFPDDPRVCMAMIQQAADVVHKAIPWADRLLTAEPNNPEGAYLKAMALMAIHDRAGAIEALRRAAAMSGQRDTHLRDRIVTAREAALAIGVSPGDAVRLAFAGPLEKGTTSQIFEGATNAIMGEMAAAKTPGKEDYLIEIAGIALVTAEKFSDAQPLMILDELSASQLKKYILAYLPDDTEIGEGGRSVGSLRAEVEGRGRYLEQCIQRSGEVAALLEAAGDDGMVSYANCLLAHGEQAAQSRLLQEAGEAKSRHPRGR